LKNPASDKKNKAIVDSFQETGYEPEGFTLYAYAAMQILARGIARVGTDGDKLGTHLKSKGFNTVLGRVNFNAKGDPTKSAFIPYKWGENESGKFTYIQY
jgi:branched-chain amino acid transport system substrate-binding protein